MATDMERVTVCVPKETIEQIYELRNRDEYKRCSFAELVRTLIECSLNEIQGNDKQKAQESA